MKTDCAIQYRHISGLTTIKTDCANSLRHIPDFIILFEEEELVFMAPICMHEHANTSFLVSWSALLAESVSPEFFRFKLKSCMGQWD